MVIDEEKLIELVGEKLILGSLEHRKMDGEKLVQEMLG